jgi:basic membrane protein A
MFKSKGILAILAVLALVAAACGGAAGADCTNDEPTAEVGLVFDIGGRGDQSFNDSAALGIEKACGDLEVNFDEASANTDGSNREELLALQSEGHELVFGVGFLFQDPMLAVATANPNVNYAIVDGFIADAPSNISMLLFAEQEGSYIVGVAAALKSEAGHVGFIGGVQIPLIEKFQAGFEAGVASVDPSIVVDVQYLTLPPDFAGFNDPAAGKVVGQAMYEGGADVVFHAAGGSGGGLFQAAKEYSDSSGTHVWAIGVDSDQYLGAGDDLKPFILTSMLKQVDVAVFETIAAQVDGTFTGGVSAFNLANDGIGYSTSGGFVDDIADELEAAKAAVVDGSVTVPETP